MEIRILDPNYLKSEAVYEDFKNDKIGSHESHFTNETVYIEQAPDFPVYLRGNQEERYDYYAEAFKAMMDVYLKTSREVNMEGAFWYSLLLQYKRDYLIQHYPSINTSEKEFRNIVLKKFDWENYIYKCVIGAQYVMDNVTETEDRQRFIHAISENLDLYNYIIKYEIFRNDAFLINILSIVQDHGLSEVMKAKIKNRPDLGSDERVGRRVIFELNKSYPVVLAPTLHKSELEPLVLKHAISYANEDSIPYLQNCLDCKTVQNDMKDNATNGYKPQGLDINKDFIPKDAKTKKMFRLWKM